MQSQATTSVLHRAFNFLRSRATTFRPSVKHAEIPDNQQTGYSYHFALAWGYEARHKVRVMCSNWLVISSAGVSGKNRKGLPINTLSSPRRAILRPESFMSNKPSIRKGTTGM